MAPVRFEVVDPGSRDAQWVMTQYFDELADRFPGGFAYDGALDEAALAYKDPTGAFVLASNEGKAVGCGAVLFLDHTTAEIKRMWISSESRGEGLGKRLLKELEALVGRAGRMTIILDTNGVLTEAIAMYEAAGYTPTERYNDNPYADHWFTKSISPTGSG